MQLLKIEVSETVCFGEVGSHRRAHLFDQKSVLAAQTAYAAERPLLVRGEPGVGKSQLAEAIAEVTGRRFIPFVVDSTTESRDLLWRFDAVKRLADAQLAGALGSQATRHCDDDVDALDEKNYILPGPVWEAFDWQSAQGQLRRVARRNRPEMEDCDSQQGCVLLIDEIDKGETEVPNGLLQALGAGEFQPQGFDSPIGMSEPRPLVVITTNEERALPDAFVRRCIVHFIELPDSTREDLTNHLVCRGHVHFPDADERVLIQAAEQLFEDRMDAKQQQLRPYPGQAEYLDLLRAIFRMETDVEKQLALLKEVAQFALNKNRGRS